VVGVRARLIDARAVELGHTPCTRALRCTRSVAHNDDLFCCRLALPGFDYLPIRAVPDVIARGTASGGASSAVLD